MPSLNVHPHAQQYSQLQHISTVHGVIPYVLCRSSRRRHVALTVTEKAEVKIYAPIMYNEERLRRFIQEKSSWVFNKLSQMRQEQTILAGKSYADGQDFLFLGKVFPLRIETGLQKRWKITFDGQQWHCVAPVDSAGLRNSSTRIKNLLVDWYKEQAKEVFPGRIFNYARIMGLDPKTIAVKTQRRSWGSCSYHQRSINLNWQLIMAPIEVIDYVVVHELAHLVHPNHSKRFWAKVENFMPNYKIRKKWLKENRLNMMLPDVMIG